MKPKLEFMRCEGNTSDQRPHAENKEIDEECFPSVNVLQNGDECNLEKDGDCPTLSSLNSSRHTKVDPESERVQALPTLPNFLYLKQSNIPNTGLGVFTKTKINVRTCFGPYRVDLVNREADENSTHNWQVNEGNKPQHCSDAINSPVTNWMRYINYARTEVEQNLHAFRHSGNIYYRPYKTISPNEELLVCYGASNAVEFRVDKRQELTSIENNRVILRWVPAPGATRENENNDHVTKEGSCPVSADPEPITPQPNTLVKNKLRKLIEEKRAGTVFSCDSCQLAFTEIKYLHLHKKRRHAIYSRVPLADSPTLGLDDLNTEGRLAPFKCPECEKMGSWSSSLKSLIKKCTRSRLYKCTQCNYSSSHSSNLQKHTRTHTGEKPYKCTQCEYSFSHSSNLQSHMRTHTGERPYQCTQCDCSFSQSCSLRNHVRTHTGEKPYKCTQCDFICSQYGGLQSHMRTHTGERPYKCTHCDYNFSRLGTLQSHMRTHTGERPYKCTHCDYSFSHLGNLQNHIRTHTGERPYKCTQCDYVCSAPRSLKLHNTKHTGKWPYNCTQCDYSSSHSGSLRSHMRKHSGEKPYKCTQCDHSFSQTGNLKRHMRLHTRERPYKCTQCNSSFNMASSLRIHTRKHTGEDRYKCTQCDYWCTRAVHLQNHVKKHTGERPYKCTQCNCSFSVSISLKGHMKKHTQGMPCKKCAQ